jgi:hypothetical protein
MGSAMRVVDYPSTELTSTEGRDLRRLPGFMVPARAEYRMPGADDEAIFADLLRSLGRDRNDARKGLAGLDERKAEAGTMTLRRREDPVTTTLGHAVLQCYYRNNRVMCAMGLAPRPPYPQGRVVEQSDWSLLGVVRGRPRMCRDVDDRGK